MNKKQTLRMYIIAACGLSLILVISLVLFALKQNINVFVAPSEIKQQLAVGQNFRLGGVVKLGSVTHENADLITEFVVTDFKKEQRVYYQGVLPDLFREGKGVIAEGALNSKHIFIAKNVLAKHDENYMPKQINLHKENNND